MSSNEGSVSRAHVGLTLGCRESTWLRLCCSSMARPGGGWLGILLTCTGEGRQLAAKSARDEIVLVTRVDAAWYIEHLGHRR